jgi:hypothetical protein
MRHFEVFLAMMLLPLSALAADHAVPARVATLTIDPREVTILHLRPDFESSIRMPEDVTSVILGSPGEFKAEHNEGEAQYVFVKPITREPAQSNLLIATKSGQHVTIELISAGANAANDAPPVDFLIEYRTARSFLIAGDTTAMTAPKPEDKIQQRKTASRSATPITNSGNAPRSALDEVFVQQAQISSSSLRQSQAMRRRNRLRQSHRHSNRNKPKRSRPKAASRLLWTPCVPLLQTTLPANLALVIFEEHARRLLQQRRRRARMQQTSQPRQNRRPGKRWPACHPSSRRNKSGKTRRRMAKRRVSQSCRTSSKTH